MKVFKCDRCGNVYDKQKEDAVYLVGKFSYINKDVPTSRIYNYIDLCDSCLAELNDWMEKKSNKEGECDNCVYWNLSEKDEHCKRCKNFYRISQFKPKEVK